MENIILGLAIGFILGRLVEERVQAREKREAAKAFWDGLRIKPDQTNTEFHRKSFTEN